MINDWIDGLWDALSYGSLVKDIEANKMTASTITLPACPTLSLDFEFSEAEKEVVDLLSPKIPYPLCEGSAVRAVITETKVLSGPKSDKSTYEFTFTFKKVSTIF